jgi:diacylglycerol kinase
MSFIFKYSFNENILIVIVGGMLLFAEAINTSIEHLCNFVESNQNEKIKIIKDIAAGSVLITGITFFVVNIWFLIEKS